MKKKRVARPLLMATAGIAALAVGPSCICGNLIVRTCPDGGTTCYPTECELSTDRCDGGVDAGTTFDAGQADAGGADGGVGGTSDGGSSPDAGPRDGGDGG